MPVAINRNPVTEEIALAGCSGNAQIATVITSSEIWFCAPLFCTGTAGTRCELEFLCAQQAMGQCALQQAAIIACGQQAGDASNGANGVNVSTRLNKMAVNGFTNSGFNLSKKHAKGKSLFLSVLGVLDGFHVFLGIGKELRFAHWTTKFDLLIDILVGIDKHNRITHLTELFTGHNTGLQRIRSRFLGGSHRIGMVRANDKRGDGHGNKQGNYNEECQFFHQINFGIGINLNG